MSTNPKTFVTRPFLDELDNYREILGQIWESGVLTHHGPVVQKLELELKKYLNIRNICVVINGTIAIQLAIRALRLKGEIITTPFSWIATRSAIEWENCKPVFADINPETLNIDVEKIESAITKDTVGILPVHVFSNPCDIEGINYISNKYGLKVIYDAAHAMAVEYKGKSILEYGDISATSFHATKLYNTVEGGACVSPDDELNDIVTKMRFFGVNSDNFELDEGTNGKMTEVHAAIGLHNLSLLDKVINDRKRIFKNYHSQLKDNENLKFQKFNPESYNYSYMPLIFNNEEVTLKIVEALNNVNIFPRRYFYPSLNLYNSGYQHPEMKISEDISKRILCMPSSYGLDESIIAQTCEIINKTTGK